MATSPALKIVAAWTCRLTLGGVFVYAAIGKLIDPPSFVADIGHYHLLPYPAAVIAGLYLPWLELVCGVAVLFRWKERGALLVLFGLCTVFSGALASAWWRGLDINCGCFGHGLSSNLPWAFARSATLGCVAAFLFRNSLLQNRTTPIPEF